MKHSISLKLLISLFSLVLLLSSFVSISAYAENSKIDVDGKLYKFDEDTEYEFSEAEKYDSTLNNKETYGSFAIKGLISGLSTTNDVPAYYIEDGGVELIYSYTDSLLKATARKWHLVEDDNKKIDQVKLSEKIKKGAILIQSSKDKINWQCKKTITNAFSDIPVQTKSSYFIDKEQISKGCYYRVIVAYKIEKEVDKKILFFDTTGKEEKYFAEVYEFYVHNADTSQEELNVQSFFYSDLLKVDSAKGYTNPQPLENNDLNYGWSLGSIRIHGFTSRVQSTENNILFLKNVGDKIILSFDLKQNLESLNNNKELFISHEKVACDEHFGTTVMDFGRGTLIVQHTDSENRKHTPQIFTDYLPGVASVDANTEIELKEEGDYEVALDYSVSKDRLIDKTQHYRMTFKFSIRNGNCMIFPRDISSGAELVNSSICKDGFFLDFTKSKYLNVSVKKEVLVDGAEGLTEDTRFNKIASDGTKYIDEGIYTITAKNIYTDQETTKQIYVGENKLLKAFVVNNLSLDEITELTSKGATINDSGDIDYSSIEIITPQPDSASESGSRLVSVIIISSAVAIVILFVIALIVLKAKKEKNK